MYLSQMSLNARSRSVRQDHRTLYETHRTVMSAFPAELPAGERVLFRREDVRDAYGAPAIRLLVQSLSPPDWSVLADRPAGYFLSAPVVKRVELALAEGQPLIFRLVANPTVKRDGRRLGLLTEEEQMKWLERKGEQGGFRVRREDVRISDMGFNRHRTASGHMASIYTVQFDGLLYVTDPERLVDTICSGIGSGKSMGMGLLSVAPVPEGVLDARSP
ncbi:MAG TPA: type I-E CRISPR-associated protein Cas6/Cse3/CasE [Aggregatilineales bacterium]|nr:type I-E CRISPR-associated protein Cas6/Cse3/CasE [Chloroflexota bacterium]HQA68653.1 type I-E CRISPR-associated protein Cas6/Cse3/CasE [Aggregatilineales bacterium]HQE17757.1 type I-E CRISPR-associated protein Cas6/Cse3/CasE [Aggregatilineales bacterium]